MMLIKWNTTLCTSFLIALVAICILPPAMGAGQNTPVSGSLDTQLLQALVSELRQIRLAMEQANAVNVRVQTTLQRIQTEQSQINRLSGELDSIRREIQREERDQAQESTHLSQLGSHLEEVQDPVLQKELRQQQEQQKAIVEQRTRMVQELHSREAAMTSSLQSEQAKLN